MYINITISKYLMCSMSHDPLVIYTDRSKKISSNYGIPFECVELVRRFLTLYFNLTFPSIKDAFTMFHKIDMLIDITTHKITLLETIIAPDVKDIHTGDIIFWKRNKTNDNWGHVAIIISSTKKKIIIAQQNMDEIVQEYKTIDLIQEMNKSKSPFLGVKRLPSNICIPRKIKITSF